MRQYLIFCALFSLTIFGSIAQTKIKNRTITDFDVIVDTIALDALENRFKIGITARQHNGNKRFTRGLNNGTLSWTKFNILVTNATYKYGEIFYDPNEFTQSDTSNIVLSISPKNNPTLVKSYKIDVPKLERFTVSYDSSAYLSPGFEIPLKITAIYSNKKSYTTNDSIKNLRRIKWKDFKISYLGKSFEQDFIYLPKRVNQVFDGVTVTATYLKNARKKARVTIPINYKAPYVFNFNGKSGKKGYSGDDARGNSGRDGKDGRGGDDGSEGFDGQDVKLYITTLKLSGQTLLKLKAESKTKQKSLIFNPVGGNLHLQCNGGKGGKGGTGGSGSQGKDESGSDSAGEGGDGGNGGDGGRGGDGGNVVVYIDKEASKYFKSAITIHNRGGKGGDGGDGGKRGKGGYVNTDDKKTIVGKLLSQATRGGGGNTGREGREGRTGRKGEEIKFKVLTAEKKAKIFNGFVSE